jgi:hypothetical protein
MSFAFIDYQARASDLELSTEFSIRYSYLISPQHPTTSLSSALGVS